MSSQIFLSYAREDARAVEQMRSRLQSAGHDVWVDTEDLRGGERWRAGIVAGIEQADTVVVVLSRSSVASDHVLTEVHIASEQRTRIIPVRLDNTEITGGFRYTLAGLQQINLGADSADGMRRLLAALDPETQPTAPTVRQTAGQPTPRRRTGTIAGVLAGFAIAAVAVIVVLVASTDDEPATPTTVAQGTDSSKSGGATSDGATDDPTATGCAVTIQNPLVPLQQEPDTFSLELRLVPVGDHVVTDSTTRTFAGNPRRWLKIVIDGQQGWIEDNTIFVAAKTPDCSP